MIWDDLTPMCIRCYKLREYRVLGRTLGILLCRVWVVRWSVVHGSFQVYLATNYCATALRMKWKYFLRYWPSVRGPVTSPHKGLWRGALIFSLIYAWIKCCVNNREAGDLRRHRAHYDVTVMGFDDVIQNDERDVGDSYGTFWVLHSQIHTKPRYSPAVRSTPYPPYLHFATQMWH